MTQKRQKDWNTSCNKRFYILQNQIKVFQKKKETQLVKPIDYCELVKPFNQSTIAANTWSN